MKWHIYILRVLYSSSSDPYRAFQFAFDLDKEKDVEVEHSKHLLNEDIVKDVISDFKNLNNSKNRDSRYTIHTYINSMGKRVDV